jgi:glycosyltransferase involved in cell wall biosynthesis
MSVNRMERKLRYAYIKNGDAVVQLKRLTPLKEKGPTSGPDAFIYSLLSSLGDSPMLLLSILDSNGKYNYKNIEARALNVTGNIFQKLILRTISVFWVFFHLVHYKPDRILCGTTGEPLWVSYIVSRIFHIPLVHSRHNSIDSSKRDIQKKISSKIDNWVIRNISALITHGPYLRDQLKAMGVPADRIIEFDVGFEDMVFSKEKDNSNFLPSGIKQEKIVLYMGRIERDKGVLDLLEAVADHFHKDKQLILVYAGDGSYKEFLLKEIASRSLNNRVMILGYVSHEKLVSLLRKSRVLVTPTHRSFPEGRCMSAMEGLVMEVPVIAPDFGPFSYLVKHGVNGLLYKADHVDDLKEKLVSIIADDNLYMELREGARETSKRLIKPPLTFGAAAECAFTL